MSSRYGKKSKRNAAAKKFGMFFAVIQLALTVVFIYQITVLNILPTKYYIPVCCFFGVFALLSLLFSSKKNFKAGTLIMELLFIAAMVPGIYYISMTHTMIKEITTIPADIVAAENDNFVSIIVMADSELEHVAELKDKNIGVDNSFKADKLNYSSEWISDKYGITYNAVGYTDMQAMVDDLYSGAMDALIIESTRSTLMDNVVETFKTDTKTILEIEIDYSNYTQVVAKPTEAPENEGDVPVWNDTTIIDTDEIGTELEDIEPDYIPFVRPGGNLGSGKNVTNSPFVVYISGIDTAGEIATTSRSDTNILMAVNPNTKKILLVSTPRDTYTPLYNVSYGVKDKLTHAGLYGITCSEGTLESIYNVGIDYYVRVNFSSVIDIVNALGGVEVYSYYTFDSQNIIGCHFEEGMNYVNGEEALVFCRERYAFGEGDYQRGRDHIEMIKAVIRKACSPSILGNYAEFIDAISYCVQTDMSIDELTSLIKMQIADGTDWTFESMSLTNTGSFSTTCFSLSGPSLYVGLIDEDSRQSIETALKEFLGQ